MPRRDIARGHAAGEPSASAARGARWKLSGDLQGPNNSLFALDRNGTSFAWGAGLQAHWGPIGGRLEYEHFQMPDTDGTRLYTAAITFTF
ncbi:MAG TPA: hypothetical protein VHE11_04190 [Steroidobacteraceae bacterium]|nr:hypothetical protein [Steroidobacteraceae bacterium]